MNYTVYMRNHCSSCERVLEFLKKEKVPCEIINVDKEEKQPPLNGCIIYPALFLGNRLLANGDDIIYKLCLHAQAT